jgi:hypothetical protein
MLIIKIVVKYNAIYGNNTAFNWSKQDLPYQT